MPTPSKGPRLGGSPSHERLILANLATSLFEHGKITTTETKAKRLQPLAERLVTFAKRGDLHSRRRVMTVIRDKSVVHKLFTELAEQAAEREGGYTRITKVGNRKGDNAPMSVIELVTEPVSAKQEVVREASQAAARAAAEANEEPAASAAAEGEADAGSAEPESAGSESEAAAEATEEESAAESDVAAETQNALDDQAEKPAAADGADDAAEGDAPASDDKGDKKD